MLSPWRVVSALSLGEMSCWVCIGMFIADSSYVLIIVVVEAVDVSIDLVGAFCFVVCRFVHVTSGTWLEGCPGISLLSLSLSACFVSQCSFSFVDFECSPLLNFDMLDVVSIGSVFTVGFRS